MTPLDEQVAAMIGLPIDEVRGIAHRSPTKYRIYRVPKRSGRGERIIHHPWKQTKMLQYALLLLLPPSLVPHAAAMAYRPQVASPLRRNAEIHAKHEYLVRIDFEDFFPSIVPEDLFDRLTAATNPTPMNLSQEDQNFLKDVFFVRRTTGGFGLPIGAPSSPTISNGVMFDLDVALQELAAKSEFTYTRYADDLVFSTNRKRASKQMVRQVTALLRDCKHPHLKINTHKTRFMSRNCRRVVTGLLITPDGLISIGREHKRRIRALICRSIHGQLDDEGKASLQGWLAYILDVEPEFFNRLCQKYSAETVKQALKRRG